MSRYVWSAGNKDVDAMLRGKGWSAICAGVCLIGLALAVAAWLIYLACCNWPALEGWSPVLGWGSAGYIGLVAVGKILIGR